MAKTSFNISVETEIKERVQKLAEQDERSDSNMAEKLLKLGIAAYDADWKPSDSEPKTD